MAVSASSSESLREEETPAEEEAEETEVRPLPSWEEEAREASSRESRGGRRVLGDCAIWGV